MPIKIVKPTTPGRRNARFLTGLKLSKKRPSKRLTGGRVQKNSGRNNTGKITIRHRGGGHKQLIRLIDFRRNKMEIPATVRSIEYDPNRTAHIALLVYVDGDQRYVLAPEGLQEGDKVITSETADIKVGNVTQLKNIPVGTPIHNIELTPGKGGQIIRSAGSSATIQSKEDDFVIIQLPSREVRLVKSTCFATIGQVSNPDHKNVHLGKAGKKRHLGIRPSVRGTAMHPGAHPHGGGEGRSGVGLKHPKTPWGKPALGKKTRKVKKYSDNFIIKDRRK